MKISLEEAVSKFSNAELNVPCRWFTGKEWENGTAEEQFRQDYIDAIKKIAPDLEIYEDNQIHLTF